MVINKKRFPLDLVMIGLFTILCALISAKGMNIPLLRVITALPLLLILPGLSIMLALFPKQPPGYAEQTIIIIGTSIMLDASLGVILNAIGLKLESGSWSIALAGITLIACSVASLRRQKLDIDLSLTFTIYLSWSQFLFIGLAALLIAGAFSLVRLPLDQPKVDQGYTVLWIQSDKTNLNVIHIGTISNEFTAASYTLSILADGKVLYESQDFQLVPGQKWETSYNISGQFSGSMRVEALLYKLDDPKSIYRQVWLYSKPVKGLINVY